jgi:FkbH-like protein
VFERLELSAEDRTRSQMYAAQRRRLEEEQGSNSVEDFLHSLDQRVSIEAVTSLTLQRAAQLTQKTNQCNTTTRRYTSQQLQGLAANPDYEILTVSVSDRFGDNGITGVAILELTDAACKIDTFLLSCRVIGRSIETALLACIESKARNRGCGLISGRFIPTKKNGPAKDLFSSHGFRLAAMDGEASVWERDLATLKPLGYPEWIRVETPEWAAESGLEASKKESLHS